MRSLGPRRIERITKDVVARLQKAGASWAFMPNGSFRAPLPDAAEDCYLLSEGTQPIGFLTFFPHRAAAVHITYILVDVKCRKAGVAGKLLDRLLEDMLVERSGVFDVWCTISAEEDKEVVERMLKKRNFKYDPKNREWRVELTAQAGEHLRRLR